MRSITIGTNDAGRRIDRFMARFFPTMPKSLIYKYLRKNGVKVNGKKATDSYILAEGDVIHFYIKDEFFPMQVPDDDFLHARPEIDIVYEDKNIILINKPVGLMVHDDISKNTDTLINRIKHYLYKSGEYLPDHDSTFSPALCNRIDRNTSGIVIAAKNAAALKAMNQKIKNREMDKYYMCLVHGRINPPSGELDGYLLKDGDKNKVSISGDPSEGAKHIITRYQTLAVQDGNSLLEVTLITGRSHQIRAHMAYAGHPIVGDRKYGGSGESKYQLLCSYKLVFHGNPDSGGYLDYLNGTAFALKYVWFAKGM